MFLSILLLCVLLALPAPALAGWCPRSQNMCGVRGLSSAVVEGIIAVESGGHPWALHVGLGKGHALYPRSLGEARRFLAVALSLTRQVDIGLMQINWQTWGATARRFGLSPQDLLDPQTNLRMGCHILAAALSTSGSFEVRLGRYHSWRPRRGRWYARRVLAAARQLDEQSTKHGDER